MEETGFDHFSVVFFQCFERLARRNQAKGTHDGSVVVNDIAGAVGFPKEMLFVLGNIFRESTVIQRAFGDTNLIKTIEIIPMSGIAVAAPECSTKTVSVDGRGFLPERPFRIHHTGLGFGKNQSFYRFGQVTFDPMVSGGFAGRTCAKFQENRWSDISRATANGFVVEIEFVIFHAQFCANSVVFYLAFEKRDYLISYPARQSVLDGFSPFFRL